MMKTRFEEKAKEMKRVKNREIWTTTQRWGTNKNRFT